MTKVLYIAGWGRSGSTLLDRILGGLEGWFSCGELKSLWHPVPCGCGAPVAECEFWSRIAARAERFPLRARAARGGTVDGYVNDVKPWDFAAVKRARRRGPSPDSPQWRHARAVSGLYDAIAADTGARVIVDSSKLATHAYVIATMTDVELHVVHLVRDPRAVAHSWTRRKARDPSGSTYIPNLDPAISSMHWLTRNSIIDLWLRRLPDVPFLRLRYEDLVADPRGAVQGIRELLGESGEDGFTGDRTVRLRAHHMIGGNPRKFETGEIRIKPDQEWVSAMPMSSRIRATVPALPLLHRYGYPVRPG
jgi:hypothetical protein